MDCFVGIFTKEHCHKQDYQRVPKEVIVIKELSEEDQLLLKLRVSEEIDTICHYHKYKYLVKFEHIFGKKCCDPLQIHKKPIKTALRKIYLEHLSKSLNIPVHLIPGKSLCSNCAKKIFVEKSCDENISSEVEFNPQSYDIINNQTFEVVDTVCESLDLSPLHKIIKLNKHQRHAALVKKKETISNAVKRKLENTFSEHLEDSAQDVFISLEGEYELLISKLKEKCKIATREEKIKIISLLPESWSRNTEKMLGGTTKREVTRASLQRPYSDQILTPQEMYNFCSKNIPGITYQYTPSVEIEKNEKKLDNRFLFCERIQGTRSYHKFIPVSEDAVQCFITSKCEQFDIHKVSILYESSLSFKTNDYLVCIYDKKWWIGKVLKISEENNDLHVHFFHPSGPNTSFKLSKNDSAWVPVTKVIRKLTPLELTTITGRNYNITQKLCNEISEIFISTSS